MEYDLLIKHCSSIVEAKRLHERMRLAGRDRETYLGNLVVDMYGRLEHVEEAGRAFQRIITRNVFSWNIMLTVFARNGHLQEARRLFDKMPVKNVVSWNSIIGAYANSKSQASSGIHIFRCMVQHGFKPDEITLLNILDVCAKMSRVAEGLEIHAIAGETGLETNVKVGTAIVNMYGKCGDLDRSKATFDNMPSKSQVTWNAMLAGYALHGQMQRAKELFDAMPMKNVVSWSALVWGYGQACCPYAAAAVAVLMDQEGIKYNATTFLVLLDACSCMADLQYGTWVHTRAVDSGYGADPVVATTVLSMYGRCGAMGEARKVFDKVASLGNVPTWNAMLGVYARLGATEELSQLLLSMWNDGVAPTSITFLAVLAACCHAGMVKEGRSQFLSMLNDHGLSPEMEHYHCMVDLLGRSGKLADADELIDSMPFHSGVSTWADLLASSRLHEDVAQCEKAAQYAVSMDPENQSQFALLNMYSADALRRT